MATSQQKHVCDETLARCYCWSAGQESPTKPHNAHRAQSAGRRFCLAAEHSGGRADPRRWGAPGLPETKQAGVPHKRGPELIGKSHSKIDPATGCFPSGTACALRLCDRGCGRRGPSGLTRTQGAASVQAWSGVEALLSASSRGHARRTQLGGGPRVACRGSRVSFAGAAHGPVRRLGRSPLDLHRGSKSARRFGPDMAGKAIGSILVWRMTNGEEILLP